MFNYDYVDPTNFNSVLQPGKARFLINSWATHYQNGQPLLSNSGAPKLSLTLSIKDNVGNIGLIKDSISAKTPWRLKALLDAIGKSHLYNPKGSLDANELINTVGDCFLEVRKGEKSDYIVVAEYGDITHSKDAIPNPIHDKVENDNYGYGQVSF